MFLFLIFYLITLSFQLLSFVYLFWKNIIKFFIFIFNFIKTYYSNNYSPYVPLTNFNDNDYENNNYINYGTYDLDNQDETHHSIIWV